MIIIVQIVLVLAVFLVAFALMRGGSNARHLAIRRILLLIFAAAAVFSIFFPAVLSSAAEFLGIGRGTDLVLYATIICFFVYMATTYQRFRSMEISITKLSRRLALDEAEHPTERGQAPASTDAVGTDGNSASQAAQ